MNSWVFPRGRVRLFDAVRGFSVVSMVLFHLCYDLVFIVGVDVAWFAPPAQDVWRASISWTFLLVSGWMCSFSHNNLTRSVRYLAVALAIFLATSAVAVDDPISFGIIFCIGASTLTDVLLERAHLEPRGLACAAALLAAFALTLNVPVGEMGVGSWELSLPASWYEGPWLAWLGLPGGGFVSGDYYPLVPFAFMYGAGVALGRWFAPRGYPPGLLEAHCAPLEWAGRHALPIYVVHQPLLLLALFALGLY
ncbi:heparan-alpha-glucosaminide N-acetyltransferase [Atopobiaceae bacterium 24-176]